jgi:parvulin-like peptidyl-prolyl isomerase
MTALRKDYHRMAEENALGVRASAGFARLTGARAPQALAKPKTGSTIPAMLALALVFLVLGMGIGVEVSHMRGRARDVVVAVNGSVIDGRAFYHRLEAVAGPQTIRSLLDDEMEYQYARKLGVAPTDAQIEERFAEARAQPGFGQWLAGKGQSADDYRQTIKSALCKLAIVSRGIAVSDAEVRTFYAANIDKRKPGARYYAPPSATVEVIVTRTQEQAQDALARIEAGKSFEDVARASSIDVSRVNGGRLPPMHLGRTRASKVPGLEQAVFNLRVGDMLGPRNIAGAWWIIRLLDKRIEATRPYEAVKWDCRDAALQARVTPEAEQRAQAGYVDFAQHSVVQAFWERYSRAVAQK